MWGYTPVGSAAHERVMEILKENPTRKEPMLLRVRFLPGTRATRSVLIEEVLAQRWAVVKPAEAGN